MAGWVVFRQFQDAFCRVPGSEVNPRLEPYQRGETAHLEAGRSWGFSCFVNPKQQQTMSVFERKVQIRGQQYTVRAWKFERDKFSGAVGNVRDPQYEARAWEESSRMACRYPCLDSLSESSSSSVFAIDLFDGNGKRVVRVDEKLLHCGNLLMGNESEKSLLVILKKAVEAATGTNPIICFWPASYLKKFGNIFGACAPATEVE